MTPSVRCHQTNDHRSARGWRSAGAGLALGVFFALSSPALAADCSRAVTQAEIDTCFGSDFTSADKAMNGIYQKLMQKLAPADQKLLRDAQRAWLPFRDKHCAFVANPNSGGSIYASIVAACATTVTVQRSRQLNARLHCQEGDMGCGS